MSRRRAEAKSATETVGGRAAGADAMGVVELVFWPGRVELVFWSGRLDSEDLCVEPPAERDWVAVARGGDCE